MTFAAPGFVFAALAIAAAVVALHLLAWRRPPATPLPTARFVPEGTARAVSRAVRPSDLLILLLRTSIVLLAGLALAGPHRSPRRAGQARVVIADVSRAVGDSTALGDSVRAAFRPGSPDALIVFDSLVREIASPAAESIASLRPSGARGSLSAALVAGIRAGERLRRSHDSVELVLVTPAADEEVGAATLHVRGLWTGPVRLVRLPLAPNADSAVATVEMPRAPADDPVAVAVRLAGPPRGGHAIRIARATLTASDSAWAAASAPGGRVLLDWPVGGDRHGWAMRRSPDTAFAVTLDEGGEALPRSSTSIATVVAPFPRRAGPPPGRVVARWSDGEPAVTEVTLRDGCVRHSAIAVPSVGDLALTPGFRRLVRGLLAPCGGARQLAPAPDSAIAALVARPPVAAPSSDAGNRARGDGGRLVDRSASNAPPAITRWLLAGALALALVELALRGVRRRVGTAGPLPGGAA